MTKTKNKTYPETKMEYELIETANHATTINDIQKIISLIKVKHVNIDSLTEHETGNTPLMFATYYGIAQLVAIYLNFTNSNINACQSVHYTALMLAAQEGHAEIIEMLLSIPDIDVEKKSLPMQSYEGAQYNAMDLYLSECESSKQPVNKRIICLFQQSINTYKKVKQYTKETKDPLLIKAIEVMDIEMIKAIIASPRNIFDVNQQKSSTGDTPLMIAMYNARNDTTRLDIIDDLLSIPTMDLAIKNYKGETAIDIFNNLKKAPPSGGMNGNARKIKQLECKLTQLIHVNKKIKAYPSNQYFLISAIKNQDLDVVEAIIAAPWKINIKHIIDDEGNTALTVAESTMNTEIIEAINTAIQEKTEQDVNFEDEVLDEFDRSPTDIPELTQYDLNSKETESNNSTLVELEDHNIELESKEETHTETISSTSSSNKDVMLPPKKRYFRDLLLASKEKKKLMKTIDVSSDSYVSSDSSDSDFDINIEILASKKKSKGKVGR